MGSLTYTALVWLACYACVALVISALIASVFDDRLGNPFYFFFVSVPVAIGSVAAVVLVMTYHAFAGAPRYQQSFVQEPIMPSPPPPPQSPSPAPMPEPQDTSLKGRLNKAKAEHIELIMRLTRSQIDKASLERALDQGIIDDIAVRQEEVKNVTNGPGPDDYSDSTTQVTGVSFVLRTPRVFQEDMASGADDGRT